MFAEFEHEILRERIRAGIAEAMLKGKRFGRPLTAAKKAGQIRKLYRAGVSKAESARRLEIDRTSVAPHSVQRNPMKKPRRDPIREDRIANEAIVDARPEEQAMGWYYYLDGKIRFPFQAKCIAANIISPLRKGEAVEAIRMAPEDNCEHDMFVQVRWQGRKTAVPLSQLAAIAPDESTEEAVGDWHYWLSRGYRL